MRVVQGARSDRRSRSAGHTRCRTSQTKAAPCRSRGNAARNWLHTRDRNASPSGSCYDRMDSSQSEFLRDLGSTDRRADFDKQPVRFAELLLAGGLITAEPRERRQDEAYERLPKLQPHFPRAAKRVAESGFDCAARLEAPRSQEDPPYGDPRLWLEKPEPALAKERPR